MGPRAACATSMVPVPPPPLPQWDKESLGPLMVGGNCEGQEALSLH